MFFSGLRFAYCLFGNIKHRPQMIKNCQGIRADDKRFSCQDIRIIHNAILKYLTSLIGAFGCFNIYNTLLKYDISSAHKTKDLKAIQCSQSSRACDLHWWWVMNDENQCVQYVFFLFLLADMFFTSSYVSGHCIQVWSNNLVFVWIMYW